MQITEIFESINGEVCFPHQGSLCTFIRTWGCVNNCGYCDTPQAKDRKFCKEMLISDVVDEVKRLNNTMVTITGGEPLLQTKLSDLVFDLIEEDYVVSIETSGSVPLIENSGAFLVVDYKLPSSGMYDKMILDNFYSYCYNEGDVIKFVVSDREDFDIAISIVASMLQMNQSALETLTFAFSPNYNKLSAKELMLWMHQEDLLKQLGAVLSLQLHKIIDVK